MSTFATFLKVEGKLVWKGMDIFIFGVCFPIILALLFGFLLKDDATMGFSTFDLSYAAVVTIGILATGVMGLPMTIADYRHRGILKRFQVTPVSPITILLAQGIIQLTAATISFIGVTLVYKLVFGYTLNGSWVLFLITFAYVTLAMYSIGILIGSLVKDQKSANIWTSVTYFSMLLFSGTTIPFEVMPRNVQWGMDILPLSHGIHLLKQTSVGEPVTDGLIHFGVLTLCIIIGLVGSLKFFKWK